MQDLLINLKDHSVYVEVTSDYNVVGNFDPNASSDLEYYGYRETEFEVTAVVNEVDNIARLPLSEEAQDFFCDENIDMLTLKVQDALDEVKGAA